VLHLSSRRDCHSCASLGLPEALLSEPGGSETRDNMCIGNQIVIIAEKMGLSQEDFALKLVLYRAS
jgi:hypothetical protein